MPVEILATAAAADTAPATFVVWRLNILGAAAITAAPAPHVVLSPVDITAAALPLPLLLLVIKKQRPYRDGWNSTNISPGGGVVIVLLLLLFLLSSTAPAPAAALVCGARATPKFDRS
jgi:hypothetical protein